MTNTPETPAQLNDLIRSVEARITTLQHERQVLVTQLQDIRRTAERLLLAFLQGPDGHAQQGRELQLRQARLRAHTRNRWQVRDPAMLATLQLRNTVQDFPADVSLSRHRRTRARD